MPRSKVPGHNTPSRNTFGDFDVVTGPPALSRPIPPAAPPQPATMSAPTPAEPAPANADPAADALPRGQEAA
jgi:hypothetical protein